jgi:isopentenyl phosphate kinase
MHGDACIDTSERKTTILSGDTLFVYLCGVYRPTYAVFLADVDGVLTGPPDSIPPPELIREINVNDLGKGVSGVAGSIETSQAAHDVTGGMRQKLDAAIEVASKFRITVFIVKAGTSHAEAAMSGVVPDVGTIVQYSP